jgi:hypothetical protein
MRRTWLLALILVLGLSGAPALAGDLQVSDPPGFGGLRWGTSYASVKEDFCTLSLTGVRPEPLPTYLTWAEKWLVEPAETVVIPVLEDTIQAPVKPWDLDGSERPKYAHPKWRNARREGETPLVGDILMNRLVYRFRKDRLVAVWGYGNPGTYPLLEAYLNRVCGKEDRSTTLADGVRRWKAPGTVIYLRKDPENGSVGIRFVKE